MNCVLILNNVWSVRVILASLDFSKAQTNSASVHYCRHTGTMEKFHEYSKTNQETQSKLPGCLLIIELLGPVYIVYVTNWSSIKNT